MNDSISSTNPGKINLKMEGSKDVGREGGTKREGVGEDRQKQRKGNHKTKAALSFFTRMDMENISIARERESERGREGERESVR